MPDDDYGKYDDFGEDDGDNYSDDFNDGNGDNIYTTIFWTGEHGKGTKYEFQN